MIAKDGEAYESFAAYGQSKTANILFTVSLDQKLRKKGLRSFAVDPGSEFLKPAMAIWLNRHRCRYYQPEQDHPLRHEGEVG